MKRSKDVLMTNFRSRVLAGVNMLAGVNVLQLPGFSMFCPRPSILEISKHLWLGVEFFI